MDTLPLELYEQIRDLTFTTKPSIKYLAGWDDIHWEIEYNALTEMAWRAHCKSSACLNTRVRCARERGVWIPYPLACSQCLWYCTNKLTCQQ